VDDAVSEVVGQVGMDGAAVPPGTAAGVESSPPLRHSVTASPEPEYATTSELARILDVTGQTVRNYRKQGLKGVRHGDGWLFKVSEARAWVKRNKPFTVQGGKRPRAGRPRKYTPTIVPGQDAAESPLARAAAAEPAPTPPTPELAEAWRQYYRGMADDVQMRLVAGVPLNRPATPAEGKHLKEMAEAHEKHRQSHERRKTLVDAEEVAKDTVEWMQRLRVRLNGLVSQVSARVMAEGQVAGEREPRVREAVQRVVDGIVGEFAGAGVGSAGAVKAA
jgi:hypothetical protein